LSRITRVGGLLLIYVWAYEQEKRQFRQQDVFVPWKMKKMNEGVEGNSQEEIIGEQSKQSNIVHQRYYHVFKKNELENLIIQCGNLSIESSSYMMKIIGCICKKDQMISRYAI